MTRHYLDEIESRADEVSAFINKRAPGCNRGPTEAKPQGNHMAVSAEIIDLTPDLARRLIANQIHNRPVSKARVDLYASEMKGGRWGLNGQGLIVTSAGKLIDGQHRCKAVIETGLTIKTMLVRGVSDAAFDIIDQGKSRSVSDVLVGVANYNIVAAGLRILWREHCGVAISHCVRMTPRDGRLLLTKHPGIVESASWVAGHQTMKRILYGGVASYTHYKSGTINAETRDVFFERLADGVGLSARSPILALRSSLIATNGKKMTDLHQLALVIKAWLAYRQGRHCAFLRYSPASNDAFPQWDA